ncbi:CfaE/CblD family pilus tip adhesin [Serratia sp. AKBS12]|uniref:CfaE/CblD family pilus tip adhesin n=1 Tax=Serratia sp. AKBS12 TaxID=2974597 RepID=UPI002165B987|nr:CfaE/CblD family pilus tip adhesin [Serratia sp. AKBS12]MCS3406719.1 pilus assembly protein CblD [Serratia sp. AKBS12]
MKLTQLFATLLSFFIISHAAAVEVSDHTVAYTVAYDKSALPAARLTLWDYERAGDNINPAIRSRDSWNCLSASDSSHGACPTTSVWGGAWGATTSIRLRFTEQRSRLSVDLNVTAAKYFYANPTNDCEAYLGSLRINAPSFMVCNGLPTYNGQALSAYIDPAEYQKIPTGGVWQASLILKQMEWDPYKQVATWTANITLDVTDRHHGDIYLPAFGTAAPLVDLNLRTQPLSTAAGGQVSGGTTLDACLYDGYNANSSWLKLTVSDLLAAGGRAADVFSVVRAGGNVGDASSRVDYRVSLSYNGKPQVVSNGAEINLAGVNSALIRPVSLPGISFPVVCTPTPLTLSVLPFAKAAKTAGRYTGVLRLTLAATALAP